jgi:hypothetical protein
VGYADPISRILLHCHAFSLFLGLAQNITGSFIVFLKQSMQMMFASKLVFATRQSTAVN